MEAYQSRLKTAGFPSFSIFQSSILRCKDIYSAIDDVCTYNLCIFNCNLFSGSSSSSSGVAVHEEYEEEEEEEDEDEEPEASTRGEVEKTKDKYPKQC